MLRPPNLTDYLNFLYQVVGVSQDNLPSTQGTATDGSTISLQDFSANWTDSQWVGYYCVDVTTGARGLIASNTAAALVFDAPLSVAVAIGDAYLIASAAVIASLERACATVNPALGLVSPSTFTNATYNLATHLLIGSAPDQLGQTFWKDLRGKDGFNLSSPTLGVVASASNDASSMSYLNPEQFKHLTLKDLQLMKTPYGREYLADAQDVGFEPFGLT